MNKYIKILAICITCSMPSVAEDTAYLQNIDNFTLQEVKEYLINDQKSMEKFVKFVENNNVRFSMAPFGRSTPDFNSNPYKVLDDNESNAKIDMLLSTMYVRQHINYPKSDILIHLDSYKMEDVFGAKRESEDFPKIEIEKILYIDKTKQQVKLKSEWEDYNDLHIEVNTSKPMERITAKMTYTLPLLKEYFISKQKPILLKEGTIKLENMSGGSVQFSVSDDALKEQIIEVDAIHASGKSLKKMGTTMYSHPSKANIAYIKKTNVLLKELVERIDNKSMLGSLFGSQSIDSKEALKEALKKIPRPTKEEQKQKSFWTYTFSGDIEKVRVVIGAGRTEVRTKELVVKKHSSMHASRLGYYKARDTQTKKEGFVGKDGKWLVQPKYRKLFMMNEYYYREEYNDDPYDIYWLNTKQNTLERVEYLLYRVKLIDGYLQMTEKVRNRQRGVVNAKTGKIIVPMKYDNVVFQNGLFVAHLSDNKKYYVELFNKQGKKLLKKSSKYSRVKIFDVDCIAATRKGEYRYDDKTDILNKKGKVLSKGKWNRYEGIFGKNKLLLVESYKRISKKEKDTCDVYGYEEQYYCDDKVAYINPKGKVVIDATNYLEAKPFSHGLAAVRDKKTELWGYINTKGKLVIPYMYKDAEYFQEKYAYVRKGDDGFLIDKMNRVHVKLPDRSMGMTIGTDSNTAEYHLYNGESYDANGKLIKKKK